MHAEDAIDEEVIALVSLLRGGAGLEAVLDGDVLLLSSGRRILRLTRVGWVARSGVVVLRAAGLRCAACLNSSSSPPV